MLDQVFSPEQLAHNPQLRALRHEVEQTGSRESIGKLYIALHAHMDNQAARALLVRSYLSDPNAREAIYSHYTQELKRLQDPENPAGTDDWNEFADELGAVAERLWRDKFLPLLEHATLEEQQDLTARLAPPVWPPAPLDLPPSPGMISNRTMEKMMRDSASPQSQALQLVCNVTRLLQVYWLDSKLTEYRASVNSTVFRMQPRQSLGRNGSAIRHAIRERITTYQSVVRAWDRQLRKLTGRSLFLARFDDAQRLRALAKQMTDIGDAEAGWAAQAEVAGDEIRYQVFEELRRGSFTWTGFPVAGFLWLIRLTTGYGMKPVRFVWTGIGTIFTFTALFFLNDFFNPGLGSDAHFCPAAHINSAPWYLIPVHYLYLAVTNLSSLGSDQSVAQYCSGVSTQVLLVASALTGYFLLATLAALMFKLLTEAI